MELADIKVHPRGAMEWALWRQLGHGREWPAPLVFRNRIKRLLDIDKTRGSEPIFHARTARGVLAEYDRFGVFVMWLGLILLDAGLKQTDVLFLLGHARNELRDAYKKIMDSPPSPGQMTFVTDRPKSPNHPVRKNHADCSVFLLIRKIELTECWGWTGAAPMIFGPKFCYGLTALQTEMDRLNFDYPSTMVVELADAAVELDAHLNNAPKIARGRRRTRYLTEFAA